ncbi:hypothetical protein CWM52_04515 [Raoultella sp. T31]|nr:hypothetical protein CWM52_04515 [Raoultella sp. T31]
MAAGVLCGHDSPVPSPLRSSPGATPGDIGHAIQSDVESNGYSVGQKMQTALRQAGRRRYAYRSRPASQTSSFRLAE